MLAAFAVGVLAAMVPGCDAPRPQIRAAPPALVAGLGAGATSAGLEIQAKPTRPPAPSCPTLECTCEQAATLGVVNVLCYGANGQDTLDDTQALKAALLAGGTNRPVILPAGVYLVSEPLDVSFHRLVGSRHWRASEGGTILRVQRPAGTAQLAAVLMADEGYDGAPQTFALVASSNPMQLENIILDANGQADHAFMLRSSGGSQLRNVVATGARLAGFYLRQAQNTTLQDVQAVRNQGAGFLLEDSNASRLIGVQSLSNEGAGIHIRAVQNSGGLTIFGGNIERVGGPAVLVENTTSPLHIENLWIEPGPTHADDVIRLHNVRHAHILGNWGACYGIPNAAGTTTNHFLAITGNSANNVIARNQSAYSGGAPQCAAIWVASTGANFNFFDANVYVSNTASLPLPILFASGSWAATTRVTLHATSPPASGRWEQGTIVWHAQPTSGQPMGWICSQGGTPGTWLALPTL